jgi:hypothetical protein
MAVKVVRRLAMLLFELSAASSTRHAAAQSCRCAELGHCSKLKYSLRGYTLSLVTPRTRCGKLNYRARNKLCDMFQSIQLLSRVRIIATRQYELQVPDALGFH